MPDVLTRQIFGTAQTVINLTTDLANNAFSGTPTEFNNGIDVDVPYAQWAQAMGEFPDWTGAPPTNTVIELWGVLKDVDGTDDDTDPPSGANSNGARFFGAWRMAVVDALQRRTIVISLEGVQRVDFYIRNLTTRGMTNTGVPCIVKIRPFSYGVSETSAIVAPAWISVSLGGSRAGSLPLAAATYDLVNAEPAFTIPTLSAAVLATARIIADVRSMDSSVSITPRLVNASTLVVAGTGVACTASADDYTGTNQRQVIPVTVISGQTYKAQAIVSAGTFGTFCTVRLEIG